MLSMETALAPSCNPIDRLYVITAIFNPTQALIRWQLYRDFANYLQQFPNVTLITVELAFIDPTDQLDAPATRFHVTEAANPNHIQLTTRDIMWYKENLINIGLKSLPANARYAAWIDADVAFTNPNWVTDTIAGLQYYQFVQMYDTCESLGPQGEILQSDGSFVYNWWHGLATAKKYGRSGGAWAARVETLQQIEYLIDWDIVGASDWFTTFGLTNQVPTTTTPCRAKNQLWITKVCCVVNGNVGYIAGTLRHFFHGYPADRGYGTRGKILTEHHFDPDRDIEYRADGLLQFATDKPRLRQDLLGYFNSRKEDLVAVAPECLYMVTCVFNPSNYQSRYNRYWQFAAYIAQFPNVKLYTIELSIKDQPFTVTTADNPMHIQLQTDRVLWYKENLLNIAIRQLPPEAKKVAWVDCDVQWDEPDWVENTLETLDRVPVAQMFETWQNLDEYDQPLFPKARGFAQRWVKGTQKDNDNGFTGLAWAANRSVLEALGGLIDWGILGSGDYHMAFALTGRNKTDASVNSKDADAMAGIIETYNRAMAQWIERADRVVQRRVGFVKGNIRHFFHGKKIDRAYNSRWKILAQHNYDPLADIGHDPVTGLIVVVTEKPGLDDDIVAYFNRRNEDIGLSVPEQLAAE